MRRLGLIGGLSWESTRLYYDAINRGVAARLGGLHSAELLIASLDFAPIAAMQTAGRWDQAGAAIADAAVRLERAGAEGLAIGSNTMHKCADAVTSASALPLLHIVDAVAAALRAGGHSQPLLLGTRFTMEDGFVGDRLAEAGIRPIIPEASDRTLVHDVIYDELCRGKVRETSRGAYVEIVRKGGAAGADSVILGCTEIGMLITEANSPLPAYETSAIHSEALVDWMLGSEN